MLGIVCLISVGCDLNNDIALIDGGSINKINELSLESLSSGAGTQISNIELLVGETLSVFVIERDQAGTFVSNPEASWVLTGSSGNLDLQVGGQSAIFTAAFAGTGSVKLTYGGLSKTVSIEVFALSGVPTASVLQPADSDDVIAEDGSFLIAWSDEDIDDDAQISLYHNIVNSGSCDTGSLIQGNLSEDALGALGNHLWDTTGEAPGDYYICLKIEDTVSVNEYWSSSTLKINAAPTLAVTQPLGGNKFVVITASTSIVWTDGDADDDASISLYYKTVNSGICSAGTLIVGSLSEDSATDTYSWDTTGVSEGIYYVCISIDDGINAVVESYSNTLILVANCTWTGSTDTDFETASNWINCGGISPDGTLSIVVPPQPINQPILATSITIGGFAASFLGGGMLTINTNRTLIYTDHNINSSIGFTGETANCTDCRFYSTDYDIFIKNNATLTLKNSIIFDVRGSGGTNYLNVGTATDQGHLVTEGGATSDEWPLLRGVSSSHGWKGLRVEGIDAANRSSVSINGLKFDKLSNGITSTVKNIIFQNFYEIKKFDNVFSPRSKYSTTYDLLNCDNGLFTDTNWDGIVFADAKRAGEYSINASSCTNSSLFTVSGTGPSYGGLYANDPNSAVNWVNDTSFVCTWNGSVDTSWSNTSNWSNCLNGRNNYPDQLDQIIVPSGSPNDITITEHQYIQGLAASGSGGGTISISDATTLYILANSTVPIESDIVIQGTSTNCTTCKLNTYANLEIYNNATLTLGYGIGLFLVSADTIKLGDGITGGSLATLTNPGTASDRPLIRTAINPGFSGKWHGIDLNGAAGNISSLNLDGLRIEQIRETKLVFDFQSNYEIVNFDNVKMDFTYNPTATGAYIKFTDCTTGLLTDNSWANLDFVRILTTGYNIDYSGAGCDGTTLNLSGAGSGYGATYENDPATVDLIW